MAQTKVKELMRRNPEVISPDSTIKEAAQKMKFLDCGVLPVGDKDILEGIITDRDIVLSAVAKGKDISQERVRDHMTYQVFGCREEDSLEEAAQQMHDHQVNRLVVRDDSGKVSGILSFGRIIREDADATEIAKVVEYAVSGKKAA